MSLAVLSRDTDGQGCPFCRCEIKGTEQVVVDPFNQTRHVHNDVDDEDVIGGTTNLHALAVSPRDRSRDRSSPFESPHANKRNLPPPVPPRAVSPVPSPASSPQPMGRRQLPPTPPEGRTGVSYAELRYDSTSNLPKSTSTSISGLVSSTNTDSIYDNPMPGVHPVNSTAPHSSCSNSSTTNSQGGNAKKFRIPSEYAVPPCFENRRADSTEDESKVPEQPPPRREGLREIQEINNKENTDTLSSINEDYVELLVGRGFEKLKVLDALRVSRNNLKMAEEILETFVKSNR
ncbi:hypothetical protein LOTGIDRAFT_156017 [Lottia gigantea]|uniref:E3 ubiquitin-protein ligase CBL n=1 Tax=Lottia gigantea TaxID=225164 RepID=V4AKQ8_LOTGI|nr:hypothetical protein LOTGIDRAFT_156017 [Lottia gigantea]ESP04794.1 hypothetical protein LOTGIDRAFT_156017 [Lottia gigantea]